LFHTNVFDYMESRLTAWCRAGEVMLRSYQAQVGETICRAVLERSGGTFCVMFPRQAGKNELQAWIISYLLWQHREIGGDIVAISPTWQPQAQTAMRRLERALRAHPRTQQVWEKEGGYIYRIGQARVSFFSGQPEANIVGATASLLLLVDEAQDVPVEKFDKEISPMAAAYNAVHAFWGTAGTSHTLLSREWQAVQQSPGAGGSWRIDADAVRQEVPEYGTHVDRQIARLGRGHPLIRSQYFSQEIGQDLSLFNPARRALMQGRHAWLDAPLSGERYALLVDVAGDEQGAELQAGMDESELHDRRDATAVTLVRVHLDDPQSGPIYQVVQRAAWVGLPHPQVVRRLQALAEQWAARYVVVDATGMGEGVASFLERLLPGRVLRFVFTQKSKSALGWAWLSAIENGHYQEYAPQQNAQAKQMADEFWRQVEFCQSEALPGPGRLLRWGVPAGSRAGSRDGGGFVHDDLLMSAALCTQLDDRPWGLGESAIIPGRFEW
jgi:hypothetical protein